jgi:hypothetical protein
MHRSKKVYSINSSARASNSGGSCSFAPSSGKQRGTTVQLEVPLSCFHNPPSTTPRSIPARKPLALCHTRNHK